MSQLLRGHSILVRCSRLCHRRYLSQSAFARGPASEKNNAQFSQSDSLDQNADPTTKITAENKSLLPTKVDIYLASLQSTGRYPTLGDLERYKPLRHSIAGSPDYKKEYEELIDTLCRSFTSEQLRRFCMLYNLESIWTRPKRRKKEYAESIIEKGWDWPCLKELERNWRDRTEIVTQTFSVNPSQLFLILGKDGSDLLQLSQEFNVHISFVPKPLSLKIQGLRGSLKKISERISNMKKFLIEETFVLYSSSPLPHNYIQRISRLSGAFVENIGSRGKVRVCALTHYDLSTAKRLANSAFYHCQEPERVPLLCYMPAESPEPTFAVRTSSLHHSYSLYPFLPHQPLPWTIGTNGVFRIRRVAEWPGQASYENISQTGGLERGAGKFFTVAQAAADVKEVLLHALPASTERQRTVTASTGYILFSDPDQSQRAMLVPPLKGHWPYNKILQWAETKKSIPSFIPSLPFPLLDHLGGHQRILYRLVYISRGSDPIDASNNVDPTTKVLKFEILIAGPPLDENELEEASSGKEYLGDQTWDGIEHISDPQCWEGLRAEVGVIMPDRPMDMRLAIEDLAVIPRGSEPTELQQYVNDLKQYLEQDAEQPRSPATLTHNGETYHLASNTCIRRSTDILPEDVSDHNNSMRVMRESILDLESNQKSLVCNAQCSDITSEAEWTKLLAHCDKLTTALHHPVRAEVEQRVGL